MATSFWVIMQKRNDGQVYADLHKTNGKMFLSEKEANEDYAEFSIEYPEVLNLFHVVELVALTIGDYKRIVGC